MSQPQSHRVRKSISRFRKITLVSVLLIMVTNFVMVHGITTALDQGSGGLINETGRMRMLSQRIRSIAFEIDNAISDRQWQSLETLHADFTEATNKLETTHASIFSETGIKHPPANLSQREKDIILAIGVPYRQLISSSREYELLIRNAIRRAPHFDNQLLSRIASTKLDIRLAQSDFLPRMDRIVDVLSTRTASNIDHGTNRARLGLFVLAFMLAGMVLFIIEPTILIVRRQLHELDKATREVRKADSVRWRLLTNMGHEFRTPMNAILGFSELLNDQSLTAQEKERLANSVHESAKQLGTLIETMLDMSAIESGQLRINTAPARVSDIINPCIELIKPKAIAAGIQLKAHIGDSCDQQVITEPKRLAQVINKLLDNAVKFTQKGSVTIDAFVEQREESCVVIVRVTDTGIGIEPEQIDHIFNPFHQAQDTLTRAFGGSGLGLSFARDLTRALGGDITVTSRPNEGSCFTIRIETDPAQQPLKIPATSTNGGPSTLDEARVLIVDDAKDNRVLLQHFFKKTNASVDFAYDGQQAVDQVNKAIEEMRPYHLILMDMQMPVLDGYAATTKLRQMDIHVPVLALTAHALDGDRERCLQAGCDDYLSKPVNRTTLIDKCNKLLNTSAAPQHEAMRAA